jgi:hypothetical protein
LDFGEEFVVCDCGFGMVVRGQRDESEREMALQSVGDADYGCFGDGSMRRDSLLDGAYYLSVHFHDSATQR